MPMIPDVLAMLVQTNVRNNVVALGHDPLSSPDPSYFIEMCTAFGKGIAQSTVALQFTTKDTGVTALPLVPGTGAGLGITVDSHYMSEKMYTAVRQAIIAKYKRTNHQPWPPEKGNSGEYLKAITDGISTAVQTHFATTWVLTSAHSVIYIGTGIVDPTQEHKFSGVIDAATASAMTALGVRMKGAFWPELCKGIAQGYKAGVENTGKANVTITGICIPLTPPAGAQACALPDPGTGTGTGVAT